MVGVCAELKLHDWLSDMRVYHGMIGGQYFNGTIVAVRIGKMT